MKKYVVATICLIMATVSKANDFGLDSIKFSGYGTLGAVKTTTDMAEFNSTTITPNGAKNKWDLSVDSRLGIQADIESGSWASTLQLAAQKNKDGNFKPQVILANVRYRATPELELKFGRQIMPIYAISDYRNVGYAYTWVRAPLEVYYMLPYNTIDGVSARYTTELGSGSLTTNLLLGNSEHWIYFGGPGQTKKIRSATLQYETGPWLVRGMTNLSNVFYGSDQLNGLFDAMISTQQPDVVSLARRIDDRDGKTCLFNSLAGSYDDGKWTVLGEYVHGECKSFIAGIFGWHATVSRKFGDFTPYITVGKLIDYRKHDADDLPADTAFDGFRGAINALETHPMQRTLALGVRWDFYKNAALKFQVDRINTTAHRSSLFTNASPAFESAAQKVNVYSITLDYLF